MTSSALSLKRHSTKAPPYCKKPPVPPVIPPPPLITTRFLLSCSIKKAFAPWIPDFTTETYLTREAVNDFWYGISDNDPSHERAEAWLWESARPPAYNLTVNYLWPIGNSLASTWWTQDWTSDRPYIGKELYKLVTVFPSDLFAIVHEIPS